MRRVVADDKQPSNHKPHHEFKQQDQKDVRDKHQRSQETEVQGSVSIEVGHPPPGRVLVHRLGKRVDDVLQIVGRGLFRCWLSDLTHWPTPHFRGHR